MSQTSLKFDADLWQSYLAFHNVETNPDGSLNIAAAVNEGANALWPYYLAARDGADRELTIAYLELLLSRTMKLSHMTEQQRVFSELLRRRADRVIFQRAACAIRPDQPQPEMPAAALADIRLDTASVLTGTVPTRDKGAPIASAFETLLATEQAGRSVLPQGRSNGPPDGRES